MKKNGLSKDVINALSKEDVPKFLATADENGLPNIVPVISLSAVDERKIIFAEFMLWKTRKNLEVNSKVGVGLITEDLKIYTIRGRFEGFQKSGEYFDYLSNKGMFRYNAYTGIRSAGVIKVEELTQSLSVSKLQVLSEVMKTKFLKRITHLPSTGNASALQTSLRSTDRRTQAGVRTQTGKPKLPPQVKEKFNRVAGAKFLSYLNKEGYPTATCLVSLIPLDGNTLIFSISRGGEEISKIKPKTLVAASVITFEPIAYQVKGTFEGFKNYLGLKAGIIKVSEVYSACPPLAGKRIA